MVVTTKVARFFAGKLDEQAIGLSDAPIMVPTPRPPPQLLKHALVGSLLRERVVGHGVVGQTPGTTLHADKNYAQLLGRVRSPSPSTVRPLERGVGALANLSETFRRRRRRV